MEHVTMKNKHLQESDSISACDITFQINSCFSSQYYKDCFGQLIFNTRAFFLFAETPCNETSNDGLDKIRKRNTKGNS